MNVKIKYNIQEIEDSIDLFIDSMADLDPILRRFSAYKRGNVKGIFKTEGAGKWKPLAPSTIKRLENTGTSSVTAQGKLRASYVRNRGAQLKGLKRAGNKAATRAKGISSFATVFSSKAALRKQRLQKKAAKGISALREHEELGNLYKDSTAAVSGDFNNLSAAKKKISKVQAGKNVSIGKRAIEKHKLLGKLANSIEAKIAKGLLTIESRIPWSEAHNDGDTVGNDATLAARVFLEVTPEDMDMFAEIAENYMLEKFGIDPKKNKGK